MVKLLDLSNPGEANGHGGHDAVDLRVRHLKLDDTENQAASLIIQMHGLYGVTAQYP